METIMKQSTFIMFKPDTIERHLENELIQFFLDHEYHIERSMEVIVDEKLILSHYEEVIKAVNKDYFKDGVLRAFLGKKVLAFEISKDSNDVIHEVRELIGATDPSKALPLSIRGRFGLDSIDQAVSEKRMVNNLIHASDSKESVERELKLWFEHK
ncbi:MAG: nucleoside-diphosphate kinase [Tenericutes bacterium HGW-Tenericutes-2]|nr:MAG: nucleoside-diphosphate kinase [Tenericutes bacterium HGW-Tenericutes-2]